MDKVFVIGRDAVPQYIRLAAGESLKWTLVYLSGAGCTIIPLEIDIDGEGCEVDLAGLYICGGEDDVRFDITVKHNCGGSLSRQLFKGIAGGKARAEFDGLIYVKKDAQKTKAYQENHNILLDETARVETRPQLEIYADDVECSHGATTGFLNPDELFYMRSRGITEAEARRLQMISFLAPVLDRLPEELREQAMASI